MVVGGAPFGAADSHWDRATATVDIVLTIERAVVT
jgi:hypothetical protein